MLLLIVASQSLYLIPARKAFFSHLPKGGHNAQILAIYIGGMPLLSALVCAFFYTAPWRYDETAKWNSIRLDFKGLGTMILACIALVLLDRAGFSYFFPQVRPPETMLMDIFNTSWILVVAGFFAVLIEGLSSARAVQEQKAKEAQYALVEAKSRLIVAQLDPHNILNILSNVGGLIILDPVKASDMLAAAGAYLRRLLNSTKVSRISLGAERAIIEDYLSVEAIRLGDRLRVEWAWDDSLKNLRLPPILVQPLVENAIKHGIWPHFGGGILRLSTAEQDGNLCLTVQNTGEPLAKDFRAGATGLQNLRERLFHEYGPAASFTLQSDGLWTVATIVLPKVSPESEAPGA